MAKNKYEYKLAIIIVIGSLGFVSLSDPLEGLLNIYFVIGPDNNVLLADIIVRVLIIGGFFFLIKKLGLIDFCGVGRDIFIRNKTVLILPFFLIISGILVNWDLYVEANSLHLTLLILTVLCVGLFEELCFRGLVLPLFINKLKSKKNFLYKAVILSSVLFGLIHYNNYFDVRDFWGVTSQVIYATSMGVFLGAFMLRTGNIFVPALIHAAFNFLFGHGLIDNKEPDQNLENIELITTDSSLEWLDLAVTIFMLLVILGIGWNMIKLVDQEAIKKDLESINI